ncbi:MAG: plastocyanin/azurin family copper-binding protein [Acidimicrobiia bacterium]
MGRRVWLAGVIATISLLVPIPARAEAAVALEGSRFMPADITVPAGETVAWTNKDAAGHSVTADDSSFDSHPACGGLGGSCMIRGETFRMTFSRPGKVAYHCRAHGSAGGGGMAGTVTVT